MVRIVGGKSEQRVHHVPAVLDHGKDEGGRWNKEESIKEYASTQLRLTANVLLNITNNTSRHAASPILPFRTINVHNLKNLVPVLLECLLVPGRTALHTAPD